MPPQSSGMAQLAVQEGASGVSAGALSVVVSAVPVTALMTKSVMA